MNKTKKEELLKSEKFPKSIKDILDFINKDSETLSLLYDLDLMPEQLEEKSHDYYRMLVIADFFKKRKENSNQIDELKR